MTESEVEELKSQIGLALAALGVSVARTLAADDVPPRVLETLREQAKEAHDHLTDCEAFDAAAMFGVYARALNDSEWFPRR